MCMFSRRSAAASPPPTAILPAQKPQPLVDTSVPKPKKVTEEDDVKKVKYGDEGSKKASQKSKRVGSESLKINLNTGTQKQSGGLNV